MYSDDMINRMRSGLSLSSLGSGRTGNVSVSGIKYDEYGQPTQASLDTLNRMFSAELGMASNDVDRMRINDTNKGILRSLHGGLSPLQFRAKGGPVLPGQPYVVGEEGPELMIPDQSGQILPNPSTQPLGFAMNAITPPRMEQPRIPERGRSLGYMTDGTTAQEMFRGAQGDYAAPTTLADLARQDWRLDPEGAAKIPVSIGGTEGYYGDPTLKGRALQNFVDVENAGIQPTSEKDRPAWLGLRSTLGKMGSQEDIAALRADMQQKTNEANWQNRMAIADMNNQRAMDIAKMNNDRAFQLATIRAARGDDNRDFRNESAMRKEFLTLPEVKEFPTITTNSKRAVSALNQQGTGSNVAVDQSIITVFNKMLDPASVVRESEYARTPQDLSVLSRIKGKWDKIQRGGAGLDANERAALGRMITNFNNIATEQYNAQVDYYTDLSKRYGYDPRNIVRLGGKRGENQSVDGAAQRQAGRDTAPAVNYLSKARDRNDAVAKIKALAAKGWSRDELAAIARSAGWE